MIRARAGLGVGVGGRVTGGVGELRVGFGLRQREGLILTLERACACVAFATSSERRSVCVALVCRGWSSLSIYRVYLLAARHSLLAAHHYSCTSD